MPKRVKLIGLLKAKAGMSRVEYERRYLEGHAPLARKFKHLSGLRSSRATQSPRMTASWSFGGIHSKTSGIALFARA
jgi:hypothetical protein